MWPWVDLPILCQRVGARYAPVALGWDLDVVGFPSYPVAEPALVHRPHPAPWCVESVIYQLAHGCHYTAGMTQSRPMPSKRPYIGITDFRTSEEVKAMLGVLQSSYCPFWAPRLGVGVMMSYKTLNGLPTKWTAAFPKNEEIAGIFSEHRDAYNVLHYADYDGNPLVPNLVKTMEFAGDHVNAIQLDMVWPNPHDVSEFRDKFCDVEIILQVNRESVRRAGCEARVIDMLGAYTQHIDYVLLDMSGGTGRPLDTDELGDLDHLIAERLLVQLAVAGGLGPDTLELAVPFFRDHPQLSIDAQSRLRPSGSALDPIDWGMAEQYLLLAAQRYSSVIEANR